MTARDREQRPVARLDPRTALSHRSAERVRAPRIVVDSWYGPPLVERLARGVTADTVLRRVQWLGRWGPLRAVALVATTRRGDIVVTTNPAAGTRTLIAITGLLGRRNLVLLEYIAHSPGDTGDLRGLVQRAAFTGLRRLLLPRALRAAHVLTIGEVATCAASHRLDVALFHHVSWPIRFDRDASLPDRVDGGRRVLCSGRRVDWETFAEAARGSDWEITAICAEADARRAGALLASTGARVLVEVSQVEHSDFVRAATVYVVAVPETGASIGQIRVMNAADAGTPLVVSSVLGVEDFVDDDCAVLVAPGNPIALRAAVDELLDNPSQQSRLRQALHARGADRDMGRYLDELAALVDLCAAAPTTRVRPGSSAPAHNSTRAQQHQP